MSFNWTVALVCFACLDVLVFMAVFRSGSEDPSRVQHPPFTRTSLNIGPSEDALCCPFRVFLRFDVLQLDGGFGSFCLFGCFRFHGCGSYFCLLFPGLARIAPNTARRPPFTSRFGMRSLSRIGFSHGSLPTGGVADSWMADCLFESTPIPLTATMPTGRRAS